MGWDWPTHAIKNLLTCRVPALAFNMDRECQQSVSVQYAITNVQAGDVGVTIAAGVTKENALEALRRAFVIIQEEWDNLPGHGNTDYLVSFAFGEQKNGVPVAPDIEKVEPQNGDKASKSAAA